MLRCNDDRSWHCTSFAALQQNPTLSRALRTCRRPGGGSGTRAYDPQATYDHVSSCVVQPIQPVRDRFFSDYFIRWSAQSRKGRQDWLVLADGDRTPPLFPDECRDDVIGGCLDFSRLVSGAECG